MGAEHACVVVTRWAPRAWKTVGVPRSRSRGAVSGAPRRRRARARVTAPRVAPPAAGPDSYKVWEIKTQARKGTSKEDDARARELLERTAWQVQPIMRKRGWRVGVLLEMPAKVRDRLGDNYNRGERVRLKLRRDDGAWEAYEQVLAVMLHELVHNAIGPHDGKFFALLAELEKECEDLMPGDRGHGRRLRREGHELGHRGLGGIETRTRGRAIDAARHAPPCSGDRAAGRPATRRRRNPKSSPAAAEAAERRARARRSRRARAHGRRRRLVGRRGRGRGRGAEAARRRKGGGRKKAKTGGSVFVPARREGGRLVSLLCRGEGGRRARHDVSRGGGDEGDRRDGAKGTRQRERERKDARVDFVAFETVAAAGGCHRHRRRRRRRVSSRRLAIRRVRAKTTNAAVARARVRGVRQCGACAAEPGVNSNCAACDRWRFSRARPRAGRRASAWMASSSGERREQVRIRTCAVYHVP